MEKRGEIAGDKLVNWILLIFSVIVIFIFIGLLAFRDIGNDTACELSVLSRASSPEFVKNAVPLKCETNKICLNEGGDCEKSFSGEKDVDKIKLKGKSSDKEDRVHEVMANEVFDCWNVFGEGKLDIFGPEDASSFLGLKPEESSCVICSRIVLDEEVEELNFDIHSYLEGKEVGNTGLSYVEKFLGVRGRNYPRNDKKVVSVGKEVADSKKNEMAVVFMQVRPEKFSVSLDGLSDEGFLISGRNFMTPRGDGSVVLTPEGFVSEGNKEISINDVGGYNVDESYTSRSFGVGYCGDLVSTAKDDLIDKAKAGVGIDDRIVRGCSLVQVVPYSVKVINSLCSGGIQP